MRILLLHSNYIEFQAIKKEITTAEDSDTDLKRFDDLVVLFTCIEKGDNDSTIENAVTIIKNSLNTLKVSRILVYPYAHLSKDLPKPSVAFEILTSFKNSLITLAGLVGSS